MEGLCGSVEKVVAVKFASGDVGGAVCVGVDDGVMVVVVVVFCH